MSGTRNPYPNQEADVSTWNLNRGLIYPGSQKCMSRTWIRLFFQWFLATILGGALGSSLRFS